MTDVGTEDAVASYLASIRAALSDLPATEVAEILDDIGPHVAEVATELEPPQTLRDRLGSPEQYAAELRAAGGYPPPTAQPAAPAPRQDLRPRLALWLLAVGTVVLPLGALGADADAFAVAVLLSTVAVVVSATLALQGEPAGSGLAAVAALPEVRWLRARNPGGAVEDYARLLQPGWWLIRAGVAALLLVAAFGLGVGWIATALLTVPLVLGSAWLGRRSQADRRWLWVVLPLNAFALVVALFLADRLSNQHSTVVESVPSPEPFGNIYPYDSSGRPLSGVFLYDEQGRPIVSQDRYLDCTPDNQLPVPANRYPQPEYRFDDRGLCTPRSAAPLPPPMPTAGPTSAPSATTATSVPTAGEPLTVTTSASAAPTVTR